MRLDMFAELASDIVTRHPLQAAALALAAALLSWVMTRSKDPI